MLLVATTRATRATAVSLPFFLIGTNHTIEGPTKEEEYYGE